MSIPSELSQLVASLSPAGLTEFNSKYGTRLEQIRAENKRKRDQILARLDEDKKIREQELVKEREKSQKQEDEKKRELDESIKAIRNRMDETFDSAIDAGKKLEDELTAKCLTLETFYTYFNISADPVKSAADMAEKVTTEPERSGGDSHDYLAAIENHFLFLLANGQCGQATSVAAALWAMKNPDFVLYL